MNLFFFIVEQPVPTAVGAVLFVCAVLLWVWGGSRLRVIMLAVIVFGLCVSSFKWGLSLGGPDKWNILISVATLLAVLAALFSDLIGKLIYRERVRLHIQSYLMDFAHGVWWIRGRITNSGDRAVKRCRVKLLKVEDQPSRIENGLLQWQGGVPEPITLSSKEHLIFDIGTRDAAQHSPLELLAYIGPNRLSHPLNSGHTYRLAFAIYGDNITTRMKTVRVSLGPAAQDIVFS